MEERCTLAMCQNDAEENKRRYRRVKDNAKEAVPMEMREKAEEALT